MKTICLMIVIMMLASITYAQQVTYQESSLANTDVFYHESADRRIQYNHGDDKYIFLQYRKAGICPYYCGFDYNMLGLGLGINHKFGIYTLFVQSGFYIIKNSVGVTKYNENLYYYLTEKFGPHPGFKSYEVTNDNTFGITVGVDIPYTKNVGFKFSYQYMKVKENIIGRFTDDPGSLNLWWNPINRDLSTINAGLYYNF